MRVKNRSIITLAVVILSLALLSSMTLAHSHVAAPFSFTSQTKVELLDSELSEFGSMSVGDSLPVIFNLPPDFAGQSLHWSSSDTSVAQVNVPSVLRESRMALVIANNPGTAVIRVSSTDGRFSYSFDVEVR